MTRDDITSEVAILWEDMCRVYNIKNKSQPSVEFFSKSSVAGKAFYQEHKLQFNEILAIENGREFMTTVAHEIAHLITHQAYPNAKQHHGPEFRSVMKTIGYDPRTYHTYNVDSVTTKRVKTRYIYVCNSCSKEHKVAKPTHTKMQVPGVFYKCKCGGVVHFTNREEKFV
jgi:SprT protein